MFKLRDMKLATSQEIWPSEKLVGFRRYVTHIVSGHIVRTYMDASPEFV